ncbi:glycoside hydrolase family 15 protein [Haloarcula marina]|uniref:glycoside hydrolase family 15 protein n=1 Tax=Haloarcula marina TaxID=2961574 RepID=UPI0020B6AD27|nr:glycoside hydrolase family 15 protein [Halomicroarcula marina]
MRRRRDFLRTAFGASIAGLAGCPSQSGDGSSGADTDDGSDGDTATTTDATATPASIEARPPRWTTGEKYGVATVPDHAAADPSRVWATFTAGAVTEVRFPRIDLMNLRTLEFLVVDTVAGETWRTHDTDRTSDDGVERSTTLASEDGLLYEQTATPTDGDWSLAVEWVTDPAREALVGSVSFDGSDRHDLYAVARTACSHSAGADVGRRAGEDGAYTLAAWDGEANDSQHVVLDDDGDPYAVALGLACAGGFDRASALSDDDGQRLLQTGELVDGEAADGVVTLAGRVLSGPGETTLAMGFATDRDGDAATETAVAAAEADYGATRTTYLDAWRDYLDELEIPDSASDGDLSTQYRVAAMTLAAVEDKTYLGAGIASPSVPWGAAVGAINPSDYGYNFVWARDLYQSFTALRAMGDVAGARRATEYVFEYQQDDSGFVPQNTFLDGRTRWGGEQLDEIAFPLVMAYQLRERHDIGFADASYDFAQIRASANYVANSGPATAQERWEEESGYSPSTIAAEIAGLTAAASLAAAEGDRDAALRWLATADDWARNVEDWCATTTGTDEHTTTPYYVRVSDDADPDDGADRPLANGGPTLDERNVIDAGFLELVRLGVVPADDPTVENSVAVVDDTIRVDTPNGPAWYRYNGDGYGEPESGEPWQSDGQGRLWPIFTGERGEYELRRGDSTTDLAPENLLTAMANFANEGRMIPEQVWDREDPTEYGWQFGEGTGSATPLSWSMAQFVRLAHGIDAGAPVETPAVVAERFGRERPQPSLSVPDLPTRTEESPLTYEVTTDAAEVIVHADGRTQRFEVTDGTATVEAPLSGIRTTVTTVAVDDTGELVEAGLSMDRQSVTYAGE